MNHTFKEKSFGEKLVWNTTVFLTDISPQLFLVIFNTDSKSKLVVEEQLRPPNGNCEPCSHNINVNGKTFRFSRKMSCMTINHWPLETLSVGTTIFHLRKSDKLNSQVLKT